MRFLLFTLVLCLFISSLSAQNCEPTPGPPLFLEDFGSGPNPGPELPPGTTTYNFGSIGGGNYVVTNTSGLNGSLWHNAPDHTEDDTDGYMLLFDASDAPGTFFQTTFDELCGNTNYIFSCFVANIVSPSACGGSSQQPDLRFNIIDPATNDLLGTTTTGSIPTSSTMVWNEYAINFQTAPGQTTLLIQVTNNAPGGCGNDLVMDDFSLRICNSLIDQAFDLCELPGGSVTIGDNTYSSPGIFLDTLSTAGSCNDTIVTTTLTGMTTQLPTEFYTFCQGDSVVINGQVYTTSISFVDTLGNDPSCPLFQPYELIAQPPQTTAQSVFLCLGDSLRVGNSWYTDAGSYVDTLSTTVGCDSVVLTTISTAGIEVSLNPGAAELELGETLQLMSTVSLSNNYSLSWSPAEAFSCTACPDPVLQPFASGLYQILATDIASGCADSAAIQINVLPCEAVYIPNAFSPNDDGINDRLEVFTKPCFTRLVSWQVFDRWGGLVYEIEDQPLTTVFRSWNGQVKGETATPGIYTYVLLLERIDGVQKTFGGDVLLLR